MENPDILILDVLKRINTQLEMLLINQQKVVDHLEQISRNTKSTPRLYSEPDI